MIDGTREVRGGDEVADYRVNGDHLDFLASAATRLELNRKARMSDFLSNHPARSGVASVSGLSVQGWHEENDEDVVDTDYSRSTGFTPLRVETMSKKTGARERVEAVSLQFRDLSDDEINLPRLPVSFVDYERIIDTLRTNGDDAAKASAATMERQLIEIKAKLNR